MRLATWTPISPKSRAALPGTKKKYLGKRSEEDRARYSFAEVEVEVEVEVEAGGAGQGCGGTWRQGSGRSGRVADTSAARAYPKLISRSVGVSVGLIKSHTWQQEDRDVKHELALEVAKLLQKVKVLPSSKFSVLSERAPGRIRDFHHWADGALTEAAYLFERRADRKRFWVLLIEWNEANGFYVVLFPEDRKGPLFEMYRTERSGERELLSWTYKPVKRDNKNKERKEHFESIYGSTSVLISVPRTPAEAEVFLSEVFQLAERRREADLAPSLNS